MLLQRSDLPAYAAHLASRDGGSAAAVLKRLERELADGALCLLDVFVTLDPLDRRVTGAVRLVSVAERVAILTEWRGDEGSGTYEELFALFSEATARAIDRAIEEVITRIEDRAITPDYERALRCAGFRLTGRRIEYKTPVCRLPCAPPSRLTWRTMADAGDELVLNVLREASVETPDGVDVEAGPGAIGQLLGGAYTTLDPRTAQIGSLDGDPIAVVLVRVDRDSGWSTLPFMGIVPEGRGLGLGRQVHLRGLETIRALGGTLYHDGTDESNVAMVRLFERHDCVKHSRMGAWRWPA